jgi:hypothetical protein
MSEGPYREPRHCQCSACLEQPDGDAARRHRDINRLVASLDERARRLFVGFLARQHGRGGVSLLSRVTGLSRNTIKSGLAQLAQPPGDARIRKKGGGRPSVSKKARASSRP